MGCSERQKEIKRRRQRRKKVDAIKRKLTKATASEKQHLAEKIRKITPGYPALIKNLDLAER